MHFIIQSKQERKLIHHGIEIIILYNSKLSAIHDLVSPSKKRFIRWTALRSEICCVICSIGRAGRVAVSTVYNCVNDFGFGPVVGQLNARGYLMPLNNEAVSCGL